MENSLRKSILPLSLFLAAFAWALLGLNPTFYVDDSPETVTACASFGIPHPPGYPLHTLLGHLFTLVPVGHLPFRVNLLSAALGAGVVAFLFLFLHRSLGLAPRLAVPLALLWMVGATTYAASLSAKTGIYQMTALFLLAILWALREKKLVLATFLLGLSFANHWMTMVTFLPAFLYLAYEHYRPFESLRVPEPPLENEALEAPARKPPVNPVVLIPVFFLGLSLYLILPLRAATHPALNWGDPSTWHNFIFDFLRSQYLTNEGQGGPVTWVRQEWVFLKTAFLEFGGLLLLAFWGCVRLARRDRVQALGWGLAWAGLAAAVGFYLTLPPERTFLILDYELPGHVFILLFLAFGLQSFIEEKRPEGRLKWEGGLVVALTLVLFILGGLRFTQARQTGYSYTHDFVLNSFKATPKDALYYCKGDAVVFPAWYFQWVEKKRTDLVLVGVDGLPMEWVRQQLHLSHPGLKVPRSNRPLGVEAIPSLAGWLIDKNPERELYFSYNKIEDNSLMGLKIVPYGVAAKGFLANMSMEFDEKRADFLWSNLRLRHLEDGSFPLEPRTRSLTFRDYAIFRNSLGIYYEDKGDAIKDSLSGKTKASDIEAMAGNYAKSYEHFAWAEAWDPSDPQFAYNLGNASFHKGRLDEAMKWYEKATVLDPDYTVAYGNWAITALQMGQNAKAGELFSRVLELKPDDAQALKGINYLKQTGQWTR